MLTGGNYTLVYNVLSFGTAVMFGAFVYFLTQMRSDIKQVSQFQQLSLE